MGDSLKSAEPKLRIIPVLDILDDAVVRGVAGERSRYRPIESKITRSTVPEQVARDLRRIYPFGEIYIADLNAIQGTGSNMEHVILVGDLGYKVMLDAGIGGVGDINPAIRAIDGIVVGTETLGSIRELRVICRLHGEVIASLDFKGDQLLARDRSLMGMSTGALVETVSAAGVAGIIYLDLVRVGMGSGPESARLAKVLEVSELPVIVGGGIRDAADIRQLAGLGAEGVLVATSLHRKTLGPREIGELSQLPQTA